MNVVGMIMDYESGSLSDEKTIELFQHLVDTGYINSLQGHYRRVAEAMIDYGLISVGESSVEDRFAWGLQ
jgi:phage antirepressor YoqD-like protein